MVEAHLALEKIYTQSGHYEMSLDHLRKALQIDSSDPRLTIVSHWSTVNWEENRMPTRTCYLQSEARHKSGSSTVK